MYYVIDVNDKDQRIDVVCARISLFSRNKINEMIRSGTIKVNGKKVKPNYRCHIDDIVEINDYKPKPHNLTAVDMPLDIIYEDQYLLVVDKPKGLVVHPGKATDENTLLHGLIAYCNALPNPCKPGLVHRLDKYTGGLIVVAKDAITHAALAQAIQEKSLKRYYYALVPEKFPNEQIVEAPLGVDPQNHTLMCVQFQNGKYAKTKFTYLRDVANYSLISCELFTGRTHQIRVHCAYLGYPIIGDRAYGSKIESAYEQALYAYKMEFMHPRTQEMCSFEIDAQAKLIELYL